MRHQGHSPGSSTHHLWLDPAARDDPNSENDQRPEHIAGRSVVVVDHRDERGAGSLWDLVGPTPNATLERLSSIEELPSVLERLGHRPCCILGHWPEGDRDEPIIGLVERSDAPYWVVLTFPHAEPHHVTAVSRHRALRLIQGQPAPSRARSELLRALRNSSRVCSLRWRVEALTSKFSGLTRREWDVLELARVGHSSKSIAKMLAISKRTVDAHRQALIAKAEVDSLASLAYILGQIELLRLEEHALTAGPERPVHPLPGHSALAGAARASRPAGVRRL